MRAKRWSTPPESPSTSPATRTGRCSPRSGHSHADDRDALTIGEAVTFSLTIELAGPTEADAVIDYRVHYVGANGPLLPKVFKLARRHLAPGQPLTVTRRHAFEHVSIRRIRPGRHTIDTQINGWVSARSTSR